MELKLTTNDEKLVCSTLGISKEREAELDAKVRETLTKGDSVKTTDLNTLAEFCTNLEEFAYAAYSYGVGVGVFGR